MQTPIVWMQMWSQRLRDGATRGEHSQMVLRNTFLELHLSRNKGGLIENWPQQNYYNGVTRNDETARSYKRVIRIIKRLRDRMQDDQITGANDIASFLIESLVWNAPVEAFQHDTYTADLRYVIADIWNRTRKDEDCSEWG